MKYLKSLTTDMYMYKSALLSLLLLAFLFLAVTSCTNEDKQATVSFIESPAGHNSELPFLYSDNTGHVFLSWVEPAAGSEAYKLMYSKINGSQWTNPTEIIRSDNWFINWADFPSLVAYAGEPVAAHTLRKIPGNAYSYNVNIIPKRDQQNWSKPFLPHFDNTATEHGFVSMVPVNNHEVFVAWLDGRRTDRRSDNEYFDLNKAMTLRSAFVDSAGAVNKRKLIDENVCDCCQTSMVLTSKGPFIAYRDRTEDEIRDIYYSRYEYENESWTDPVPVHDDGWKIGACPVNGPKAAAKDSMVVVAWYTNAENNPTVKAAISVDSGASFGNPFILNNNGTLGRVDVAIADSQTIYLSEISRNVNEGKHYLTAHRLNLEDGSIQSFRVTEMSGSRRSGFPQMEFIDNKLLFVWTDVTDDTLRQVQTATLQL